MKDFFFFSFTVSQIWMFTEVSSLNFIILDTKSSPMVVLYFSKKTPPENIWIRHDLPTPARIIKPTWIFWAKKIFYIPESPINKILNERGFPLFSITPSAKMRVFVFFQKARFIKFLNTPSNTEFLCLSALLIKRF